MKTIVSFETSHGYESVGMNNRVIFELKTLQGIINKVRRLNLKPMNTKFKIIDFNSDKLLWEGRV